MVYLLGAVFFTAALLPTYVLSRVLLVFFWRAESGAGMIGACHIGSYLFCVLVGAMGFAAGDPDGGGAKIGLAALSFMLPQFLWMITDIYKFEKRAALRAVRNERARVVVQPMTPAVPPVALLPPPDEYSSRG